MEQRKWNLTDREREAVRVETIERLATEKEVLIRERDEARAWATLFRDFVGWTPQEHYESYRRYLEAANESAYPDWLKDAK